MDSGFDNFNGFDGFDDTGFNSSGSNMGSDDFGFGFDDDTSFDSTNTNSGLDDNELGDFDFEENTQDSTGQFDGAFDTNDNYTEDESISDVKKQGILFVIVGVIAVIVIIFIATNIVNKPNKQNEVVESVEVNTEVQKDSNTLSSKTTETKSNTSVTNNDNYVSNEFDWVSITANENIQINSSTSDMVFTVTSIEHKARTVDTKGNLVVKTRLLGSISGMTGTYEIDIPYNKGNKLVVGDSFTVKVLLGTFKDKTVVVDIRY